MTPNTRILIPRACEYAATWQIEIGCADKMKVSTQLTLRKGELIQSAITQVSLT